MNGPEHFVEAERLLKSCQLQGFGPGEAEQYPAREDGVDSIGNALTAAQVHATLALAAATALTGGGLPDAEYRAWNDVAGVPSAGRKAIDRLVNGRG